VVVAGVVAAVAAIAGSARSRPATLAGRTPFEPIRTSALWRTSVIQAVKTSKGTEAITSDRWHVVHSHFTKSGEKAVFVRTVHSEHDDRNGCVAAARLLCGTLSDDNSAVPVAHRDEVFVCRPHYKSLERSRHRRPKKG
jgi:hypothetical protein